MLHCIMAKSSKGTSPQIMVSLYVPSPKSPDGIQGCEAAGQHPTRQGPQLLQSQLEQAQREQKHAILSLTIPGCTAESCLPAASLLHHGPFFSTLTLPVWLLSHNWQHG